MKRVLFYSTLLCTAFSLKLHAENAIISPFLATEKGNTISDPYQTSSDNALVSPYLGGESLLGNETAPLNMNTLFSEDSSSGGDGLWGLNE
ncbi:MAG: hypothetical protein ACTSXQ_02965 [Alphaproteobacteria bacterium]